MKVIDLVGEKVGFLEVISQQPSRASGKQKRPMWLCRCECGRYVEKFGEVLRRNKNNDFSCGCKWGENISKSKNRHGLSHSSEHNVWMLIKGRCNNINNKAYKNYGGRGIKICDRWLYSFEAFIEDMGMRPSNKHSIDRINNNGHYEPSNCRWTTKKEQNNNRRDNLIIEYNGNCLTLSECCDMYNLKYKTVYSNLRSKRKTINEIIESGRYRIPG